MGEPWDLKPIVVICYFHRRSGPMVFYSYPEGNLDDKLATRIAIILRFNPTGLVGTEIC